MVGSFFTAHCAYWECLCLSPNVDAFLCCRYVSTICVAFFFFYFAVLFNCWTFFLYGFLSMFLSECSILATLCISSYKNLRSSAVQILLNYH